MSFADDLRQQSEDRLLAEEKARLDAIKAKEDAQKAFFATRKAAILSGEAVSNFYEGFKRELIEVASQCTSDDSKHKSGTFIYLPEEFFSKKDYYESKREELESYYDSLNSDSISSPIQQATRKLTPLYYDTIIPHQVFDAEECDIIQKQLEEIFSKDGLRCSIERKKIYKKLYEEIELGRWRKTCDDFCGYSIKFDAKWHPWDATKPISSECLKKIRCECLDFQNSPDYVYIYRNKDRKFLARLASLGLEGQSIFLREDTTFFCSGKEGYAFTPKGIYWLKKDSVHIQSYQELADEQDYGNDKDIFSRIRRIVRADLS